MIIYDVIIAVVLIQEKGADIKKKFWMTISYDVIILAVVAIQKIDADIKKNSL